MSRNNHAAVVPRSVVRTPLAPAAIGPYSQGILVGDTLYASGQIAIDPKTGSMITDSIEAETERVLENLGAVLHAVGMDYEHVVRCTVYMTDINAYAQVNEIYARYFNETPPSREAVQVAALPRSARVEISCIAVR
ncbi:MAG: RidA family protein [Rhodothermales bacterium]